MMSDPTKVKTPVTSFTGLLNADEARQCCYALNELANRRAEQGIDRQMPHLRVEAHDLRELSAKIAKHYGL